MYLARTSAAASAFLVIVLRRSRNFWTESALLRLRGSGSVQPRPPIRSMVTQAFSNSSALQKASEGFAAAGAGVGAAAAGARRMRSWNRRARAAGTVAKVPAIASAAERVFNDMAELLVSTPRGRRWFSL